jgi:hypothetical protein
MKRFNDLYVKEDWFDDKIDSGIKAVTDRINNKLNLAANRIRGGILKKMGFPKLSLELDAAALEKKETKELNKFLKGIPKELRAKAKEDFLEDKRKEKEAAANLEEFEKSRKKVEKEAMKISAAAGKKAKEETKSLRKKRTENEKREKRRKDLISVKTSHLLEPEKTETETALQKDFEKQDAKRAVENKMNMEILQIDDSIKGDARKKLEQSIRDNYAAQAKKEEMEADAEQKKKDLDKEMYKYAIDNNITDIDTMKKEFKATKQRKEDSIMKYSADEEGMSVEDYKLLYVNDNEDATIKKNKAKIYKIQKQKFIEQKQKELDNPNFGQEYGDVTDEMEKEIDALSKDAYDANRLEKIKEIANEKGIDPKEFQKDIKQKIKDKSLPHQDATKREKFIKQEEEIQSKKDNDVLDNKKDKSEGDSKDVGKKKSTAKLKQALSVVQKAKGVKGAGDNPKVIDARDTIASAGGKKKVIAKINSSYGLISYSDYITEKKEDKPDEEEEVDLEKYILKDDVLKKMKDIVKQAEGKKDFTPEEKKKLKDIKDTISLHDMSKEELKQEKEDEKLKSDIEKEVNDKSKPITNDDLKKASEDSSKEDEPTEDETKDDKDKKSFDDVVKKEDETKEEPATEGEEETAPEGEEEPATEGEEEVPEEGMEDPMAGSEVKPEDINLKEIKYTDKLNMIMGLIKEFGISSFDYKIEGNENTLRIEGKLDDKLKENINSLIDELDINITIEEEKDGKKTRTIIKVSNKLSYDNFVNSWKKEKAEKETAKKAAMDMAAGGMPPM